MKSRLLEDATTQTTIIHPPPIQEMNASEEQYIKSSSSEGVDQYTDLELQPV